MPTQLGFLLASLDIGTLEKLTCLKIVICKIKNKPYLRTPVAGDGRAEEEEMLLIRRHTYNMCGKTVQVESEDEDSLEKSAWCWLALSSWGL